MKKIIKWIFWLFTSLILFNLFMHYRNWDNGYCWRCHYGRPFSEYMFEWDNYDFNDNFIVWIILVLLFLITYFIVKFLYKIYLKNRKV